MPLSIPFPAWISPEIIPGLPFRWYGLMYLAAFGTAWLLFMRQVKTGRLDIQKQDAANFFFWAILGLLAGARIFAALVYDTSGRFLRNPLLIFWPFDEAGRFSGLQGMSYHGGLIGAVAGAVIYARLRRLDILLWGDLLTAAIPLGYTFGRLGNFINGELYGRITALPWGMLFPSAEKMPAREPWVRQLAEQAGLAAPTAGAMLNLPRHPSQLYEALFEGLVLWLVLWFIVRKRKPFKGFVIGAYVLGYGLVRFFIEYFREPDRELGFILRLGGGSGNPHLLETPFDFTMGQLLCLLMMAAGAVCLLLFRRLSRPDADAPARAAPNARRLRRKLRGK